MVDGAYWKLLEIPVIHLRNNKESCPVTRLCTRPSESKITRDVGYLGVAGEHAPTLDSLKWQWEMQLHPCLLQQIDPAGSAELRAVTGARIRKATARVYVSI